MLKEIGLLFFKDKQVEVIEEKMRFLLLFPLDWL